MESTTDKFSRRFFVIVEIYLCLASLLYIYSVFFFCFCFWGIVDRIGSMSINRFCYRSQISNNFQCCLNIPLNFHSVFFFHHLCQFIVLYPIHFFVVVLFCILNNLFFFLSLNFIKLCLTLNYALSSFWLLDQCRFIVVYPFHSIVEFLILSLIIYRIKLLLRL